MGEIVETTKLSAVTLTKIHYIVFNADDVSTSDTIVIDALTTLTGAALFNRTNGVAVSSSIATDTITVTQAAQTNILVVGIATGTE